MKFKKKHVNIYHFCIFFDHFQHIKITFKTILSKIFEQNVDYAKVESRPIFHT